MIGVQSSLTRLGFALSTFTRSSSSYVCRPDHSTNSVQSAFSPKAAHAVAPTHTPSFVFGVRTDDAQVQELLLALTPRLQDPESLRGLLEMHLTSEQVDALQVTTPAMVLGANHGGSKDSRPSNHVSPEIEKEKG